MGNRKPKHLQSLIDVTESDHLTQVYNRESKLLDLVFNTNPTIITHSTCVPGISDHEIIVIDFDVKFQCQ